MNTLMNPQEHITSTGKKVIYDFGSNNGDDIPYYLGKSDLVVAVEANPVLSEQIRNRFRSEISEGRLVVESCVLTTGTNATEQLFYIHKSNHVLSQFPKPDSSVIDQFEERHLPAKNVVDIVRKWGDPYYIKIDVEYYDHILLRELFMNNIRPPYISAESHDIDVFCVLVALGGYQSFKLVDGPTVAEIYRNQIIDTNSGPQTYSFPHHSAGPFGNDVHGDWMTKNNFHRYLGFSSLGWKDIHASNVDAANASYAPSPKFQMRMGLRYQIQYSR